MTAPLRKPWESPRQARRESAREHIANALEMAKIETVTQQLGGVETNTPCVGTFRAITQRLQAALREIDAGYVRPLTCRCGTLVEPGEVHCPPATGKAVG